MSSSSDGGTRRSGPAASEATETAVTPQSSAPPTAFRISVIAGSDRGKSCVVDASGMRPRTLVGQSDVCDLRLTDREVSRRHLALEHAGAQLRVIDLGSTNGTRVGTVRVRDVLIDAGTTIALGSTALGVERFAGPQERLPIMPGWGNVIGYSRAMRRLYPSFDKLAQSDVPIILEGETGTGKEVLAESIHEIGRRKDGPFVVFDCTAVPASLVESELFGHERGAFTGAVSSRRGVFEQAHGGTLLIDEIGDLDLSLQPKLLRALEKLEVRRVGSETWHHVDVRVVAATRRDLDREVAAGRFRDDLYHRLSVAHVELPPLRDRDGDIEILAHFFWRELGGLEENLPRAIVAKWADSPWPGNVRELRNAVARYHALGEAERRVSFASFQPRPGVDPVEEVLAQRLSFAEARAILIDEFERRYVERILAAHGGDTERAATASGIGRRYFQKVRKRTRR